jgi:beta-galactosidase
VKIYSNASEAELFVNGVSAGLRHRNSQNFPAAGLRWSVLFRKGLNHLLVVAHRGKEVAKDSVEVSYQTENWKKTNQISLDFVEQRADTVLVRARILDSRGVPCLDAVNWIHWGLAGDGRLVDDQGTSTGSRVVQACNGVSMIRIVMSGGSRARGEFGDGAARAVVTASSEGLPTGFLNLRNE